MPLSGSIDPSSGKTPISLEVTATGGTPPYTLRAAPSPPNPTPMPDHTITPDPLDPAKWKIDIEEGVAEDTELHFRISDANQGSSTVTFTSTGPL